MWCSDQDLDLWLSGSRYAKICVFTNPEPREKHLPKLGKNEIFVLKRKTSNFNLCAMIKNYTIFNLKKKMENRIKKLKYETLIMY